MALGDNKNVSMYVPQEVYVYQEAPYWSTSVLSNTTVQVKRIYSYTYTSYIPGMYYYCTSRTFEYGIISRGC